MRASFVCKDSLRKLHCARSFTVSHLDSRLRWRSSRYDVSLAVLHEDNLPRAERRQDRLADTALELAGRMSRPLLETERSTLLAELGLSARWWTEHPDLSEFSPALGLRYWQRLGPDFSAPWLELAGTARGIKTADSVIREHGAGCAHGLQLAAAAR